MQTKTTLVNSLSISSGWKWMFETKNTVFFYCVTLAKVISWLFSYRPVVVIQVIDLLTRFSRWTISLHPLDLSQVSIWKQHSLKI